MYQNIDISGELSRTQWMLSEYESFNGCCGNVYEMSPRETPEPDGPFSSLPSPENFWDYLQSSAPQGSPVGRDKRVRILTFPVGTQLPSPRRWFTCKKGYRAWYLHAGDDIIGVVGTYKPVVFSEQKKDIVDWVVEPDKYAGLQHLFDAGLFDEEYVKKEYPNYQEDIRRPVSRTEVRGRCSRVSFARDTFMYAAGVNPLYGWSDEIAFLTGLPWWERYRLAGRRYIDYEMISKAIGDHLKTSGVNHRYHGIRWCGGNARHDGPEDSFRVAMSLRRWSGKDDRLSSTHCLPTSTNSNSNTFFKVLPFMWHSPQHNDHRCGGVLFHHKPLWLSEVPVHKWLD